MNHIDSRLIFNIQSILKYINNKTVKILLFKLYKNLHNFALIK